MGKVAFVFSGQGSQYSGMGQDLYNNDSASSKVFSFIDKIRPGTSLQCFSGTDEELAQTSNTQPCIFAMEMAAVAAAVKSGIKPDMAAGFSLGEIAALTFTGVVSFEVGFRLVCLRGELMQADAEKHDSTMAAVLRLDAETVSELCSEYEHVYPVNYSCPDQISVSGLRAELEDFIKKVKTAGGRAVPLRVKGGFHSPFMNSASLKFREALENVNFRQPAVPLYSNYTALPYENDFINLLSQQICKPIKWQEIIENMIKNGVDTFIEIGPGKTLCGLIKKTDSSVRTLNIEDSESLARALKEVYEC